MVGLESALSVVQHALVDTGHISWSDVARVLSVAPATIGRVEGYAAPLAVGSTANITLVDPAHTAQWESSRLHGRSSNSPFLGIPLPGRIVSTIFNGTETVIDGVLVDVETLRKT
jgi:dihydroorotase